MRRFIVFLALSFSSLAAHAAATQDLHRFFNQVQRYHARFTQVTVDEAKKPVQESSGDLWIERPGKFRWNYSTPFEQQIVGDGKQVWVYDVELKQVAVRGMQGVLGATPAIERRGITLVGLALANLDDDDAVQLGLPFGRHRAIELDGALDEVRERYGSDAVTRAVLVGREPGISMPLLPD